MDTARPVRASRPTRRRGQKVRPNLQLLHRACAARPREGAAAACRCRRDGADAGKLGSDPASSDVDEPNGGTDRRKALSPLLSLAPFTTSSCGSVRPGPALCTGSTAPRGTEGPATSTGPSVSPGSLRTGASFPQVPTVKVPCPIGAAAGLDADIPVERDIRRHNAKRAVTRGRVLKALLGRQGCKMKCPFHFGQANVKPRSGKNKVRMLKLSPSPMRWRGRLQVHSKGGPSGPSRAARKSGQSSEKFARTHGMHGQGYRHEFRPTGLAQQ